MNEEIWMENQKILCPNCSAEIDNNSKQCPYCNAYLGALKEEDFAPASPEVVEIPDVHIDEAIEEYIETVASVKETAEEPTIDTLPDPFFADANDTVPPTIEGSVVSETAELPKASAPTHNGNNSTQINKWVWITVAVLVVLLLCCCGLIALFALMLGV
jgi:hypothetical protein